MNTSVPRGPPTRLLFRNLNGGGWCFPCHSGLGVWSTVNIGQARLAPKLLINRCTRHNCQPHSYPLRSADLLPDPLPVTVKSAPPTPGDNIGDAPKSTPAPKPVAAPVAKPKPAPVGPKEAGM